MAASKNINTIAAGQIIISIGSAGLDMVTTIILGDLTPLQWRGLAQSLSGSPYIINGFVAGLVTDNFGVGGWRWVRAVPYINCTTLTTRIAGLRDVRNRSPRRHHPCSGHPLLVGPQG